MPSLLTCWRNWFLLNSKTSILLSQGSVNQSLIYVLKVAGAFGSVALQQSVQRAFLKRNKMGEISESDNTRLTLQTAESLKQALLGLGTTFIKGLCSYLPSSTFQFCTDFSPAFSFFFLVLFLGFDCLMLSWEGIAPSLVGVRCSFRH